MLEAQAFERKERFISRTFDGLPNSVMLLLARALTFCFHLHLPQWNGLVARK